MVDHVSVAVRNFKESVKFYDATLKLLGYEQVRKAPGEIALYGVKGTELPNFIIAKRGKEEEEIGKARGLHIAFKAPSKEAISTWYNRALELGAHDNGKPGYRPEHYAGYYAAYVIDPDGWRLEAVYHDPTKNQQKRIDKDTTLSIYT